MEKRTIERYRQVQRVMLTLPKPEKFRINEIAVRVDREAKCPTSACALGWCGLDPWFTRRGLKLEWFKFSSRHAGVTLTTRKGGEIDDTSDAIAAFFNDDPYSSHIFGMGSCKYDTNSVEPTDVVLNIERRLMGLDLSDYDVGRTGRANNLPTIKLKELRSWGARNKIIKKVEEQLGLPKPA